MARRRNRPSRDPAEIERIAERVGKRIKPASKLPQNVRFLIYGRGGVGKTRLCATAPDVLLMDVNDLGWDSVRRDLDPQTLPIEYWTEIDDAYWYLQAGEHPFRTVAVDGITAMQNLCMKFVMGDEAARDASRDPEMPSRQVYGKVSELMKTQITNFRNLPMNVIFTARQRTRVLDEGDEEGEGEIFIGPNCSPAIGDYLEGAVPLVGHLSSREVRIKSKKTGKIRRTVRRRLLVGPSERYATKDRYGVFGPHIDAPDIEEMISAIYEKGDTSGKS